MAQKIGQPLPQPDEEYNAVEEATFRRQIEQSIEDLYSEVERVEAISTAASTLAHRRHTFLLLGL